MCTYSPHYPALVAEHPIKCYKYLYKSPNGEYLTPYQLTPVEEGMTYKISEEQLKNRQICVLESYRLPSLLFGEENFERDYREGETFFEISRGAFHSFIDYGPCTDRFNKHALDRIFDLGFSPSIAVCYIPTKTKYFVGWNYITFTDTIMPILPDKADWVQRTPEHCYSAQGDPDCYASEEIFYAKIYDNLKDFYENEAPHKMW